MKGILELVRAASEAAAQAKADADATVYRLTGGAASSIGELDKIIEFSVKSCGYTLPDMQRATLEARLNDPALPVWVFRFGRIKGLSLDESKELTINHPEVTSMYNVTLDARTGEVLGIEETQTIY